MAWSDVQEAVRQSIALAAGLPDKLGADNVTTIKTVEWGHRDTAHLRWFNGPYIDLFLTNVQQFGNGETRYGYDSMTDRLLPAHLEYCTFTVMARVMSTTQDPAGAAISTVAGKVRARMRTPAQHDILHAANTAYLNVAGSVQADYLNRDSRFQSACAVDLRFSTVEIYEETSPDYTGDYVKEAAGTGELTAPDGSIVDSSFDTALE